jgi:hypothetical protein
MQSKKSKTYVWLTFALVTAGVVLAVCQSRFKKTKPTLLPAIFDHPGAWSQMCASPPPVPFHVPVPISTGAITYRHFNLGAAETKLLQNKRPQVIAELSQALQGMSLAKSPKVVVRDYSSEHSGERLEWLCPMHLQVIRSVSAIELLPEILNLEEQLADLLEAAEHDPDATLPALDFDLPGYVKEGEDLQKRPEEYWKSAEHRRNQATVECRAAQRELLGTVTLLLQREGFAQLAILFRAELQETLANEIVKKTESIARMKHHLAEMLSKDPKEDAPEYLTRAIKSREQELVDLKTGKQKPEGEVPYTPVLRAKIRELAATFLKTVPPEKRQGAAAMPPVEEVDSP